MLRALLCLIVFAISAQLVRAGDQSPFAEWSHNASFYLLTTPEGAALPAEAHVENFPVLLRLTREAFDFNQAQPHGEDLRFATADGKPLKFQIDEWDGAAGTAAVWIRVPRIDGNARQELRAYWGNLKAQSESLGPAVFNADNGFVSVWHLGASTADDAGTLQMKDTGTESSAGVIGRARRFSEQHGLFGGDKIATLPSGSAPHSTQAWMRAENVNGNIVAWGNEAAQGKVVMQLRSPPHISMDCYFSGGGVAGASRLKLGEWVHVVHTYQKGEACLYINGKLDGQTRGGTPMNIKSPARLWIGGWYNRYSFEGDLDEVRLSSVARPAEWVKLEYENQNPRQMLAGTFVQPGTEFNASSTELKLDEGASATVTARAGGAQKVFWTLERDGVETTLATDTFSLPFNAGRVTGDAKCRLRFKAVYAENVRSIDIPVVIKEVIPEPAFTLSGPATWSGRGAIEIVPAIQNLAAMQAKNAAALHTRWNVKGGAVIKEESDAKLVLKRSQFSGPLTITASISNGGAPVSASMQLTVTEPPSDPYVYQPLDAEEHPEENRFYARDVNNEGILHHRGKLEERADEAFIRVFADGKQYASVANRLDDGKTYQFAVRLKPGLVKYKAEWGTRSNGKETVTGTAENIVCGDAYIIEGQSNALATDTHEVAPPETNEWIRSYGSPPNKPGAQPQNLWCLPVWKARQGEKAELGYWGMELAKRLVASQKMPICIINGAVGGTRIDQHQRNPANPEDTSTIYGRLLWRVKHAHLTHGIRAVLWHQGENDQGADGPTGGFGWETYHDYFDAMSGAWREDFPNLKHIYVFQIWPKACAMGVNGSDNMLREMQRQLASRYSHLSILSTLGIKPPGGCHYPLAGWAEFARLIQPLIERDFYNVKPAAPITPPNLIRARFANDKRDEIALEFDQPVVWSETLASQFYVDGVKDLVRSGSVAGNVLTLHLTAPATGKRVTYLDSARWKETNLLMGANGIAALTFCEVAIEQGP